MRQMCTLHCNKVQNPGIIDYRVSKRTHPLRRKAHFQKVGGHCAPDPPPCFAAPAHGLVQRDQN